MIMAGLRGAVEQLRVLLTHAVRQSSAKIKNSVGDLLPPKESSICGEKRTSILFGSHVAQPRSCQGCSAESQKVLWPGKGSCVSAYSSAPQQRNAGDQTTAGGGTVDDGSYAMRTLEKRAMKLEEQVQELTELYQKAVSNSEIVRKKTQKFVEDAKLFGIQSFCRDLVEVADILEDATEKATKEGVKDMSEVLSVIDGKLRSVLLKHGLHKMTPVGGNYDPYEHEIVCHVPAEGRRPGSIATVSLDGYKLHGRTVRHAHVGIAVETHK